MKTIELSTMPGALTDLTAGLGNEPVILTENHEPVAAIISLKHSDRETLALRMSAEFLAIIDRARREFASGETLSLEAMKRAVLP